jgi:hypothetical protein
VIGSASTTPVAVPRPARWTMGAVVALIEDAATKV